jgi:hypothetical protein
MPFIALDVPDADVWPGPAFRGSISGLPVIRSERAVTAGQIQLPPAHRLNFHVDVVVRLDPSLALRFTKHLLEPRP